jgi:hypothetical protein
MRRFNAMAPQFADNKIAEHIRADFAHDRYATVQAAQIDSRVRGTASHTEPKPVYRLQFAFSRKGIHWTSEYICDQNSNTGHIHCSISVGTTVRKTVHMSI